MDVLKGGEIRDSGKLAAFILRAGFRWSWHKSDSQLKCLVVQFQNIHSSGVSVEYMLVSSVVCTTLDSTNPQIGLHLYPFSGLIY